MTLENWKQQTLQLFSSWKYRNSNDLMGLDFGPGFLKLLKINSSETKYKVENFSIAPLPPEAMIKGEIKDIGAMVNVLREAFKQSGMSTKNVAFSIPRSSTIIKTITVDSRLTAEEIESRAWIEANRLFPDLISDIYLDFTITGPSVQDKSQLELLFVACRKDQIKPYLEILEQAGLSANVVDVNSYALERAVGLIASTETTLETVALLNLNMSLSTFIVIHQHQLIHAHDQSYDCQNLLARSQTYLKEKNISDALEDSALMEDEEYSVILQERLISHLRHTLHFFYSSRPNINIQQIILAGDCASVRGLALFIAKEIGVPTTLANPFENMLIAPNVDATALKKHGPTLMLCCGLALSKSIMPTA